jgi:quercetin dioxygenase-like cupin family protein
VTAGRAGGVGGAHVAAGDLRFAPAPAAQAELAQVREALILGGSPRPDGGPSPFRLSLAELAPGGEVPLHRHAHAETIFVLAGRLRAQRQSGRVELEPACAAYFPGGVTHGLAALDEEPVRYLCLLATERLGAAVASAPVPAAEAAGEANPNTLGAGGGGPWALAEEFVRWEGVEPTKGRRQRNRYLFRPGLGGGDELIVGTLEYEPRTHYTRHVHAPAQLYHVLAGRGTIHVGPASFDVEPGSTVFVPPQAAHGIDAGDGVPLRLYWAYGIETCGPDWVWTAVEDVYNDVR